MKIEEIYQGGNNFSGKYFELTEGDIAVIQKYVKNIVAPNCYLEIGTKYGGSAMTAKLTVKEGIEIYTIDISDECFKETKQMVDSMGIHFIHKPSLVVARDWSKPIGVLFIDGNHNQAMQDFGAWEKYLIKDGIVLFHDYYLHSPMVMEACHEIAEQHTEYKVLFTPQGQISTSIFQAQKL